MDIVLRESERLNAHHLVVSRLRAARSAPSSRRVDLRRVRAGRGGPAAQQPRDCSRTTSIVVDTPPDPVWLDADEEQLRQIVWNLATNSLKAMPRGGAAAAVRVGARTGSVLLGAPTRASACRPRRVDAHVPAVPRRVRPRHRPRAGDRPPHRHRLQWATSTSSPRRAAARPIVVRFPAPRPPASAPPPSPQADPWPPQPDPEAPHPGRRRRGVAARACCRIVLRKEGYEVTTAEDARRRHRANPPRAACPTC